LELVKIFLNIYAEEKNLLGRLMNHREEPMSARSRKKVTKAVREGQKVAAGDQPAIRNTRGQNPAKASKKETKRLVGELRKMRETVKRKKLAKAHPGKLSKRTTPGQVDNESPPQYPHMEGSRWAKTTTKQSLLKSKLLSKRLSKKK
jgi:hypothetical protein